MGRRDLHILLISAKSLPKKGSSEMQVYAKAYLSYKPKLVQFTAEDPQGGVNPRWNDSFRFILKSRKTSNEFLNIDLYNLRPPTGNEADPVLVGHVQIPLETFQNENNEPTAPRKLSLIIPEGGTIHFSYKLGKNNSTVKAVSKKIANAVVGTVATAALGYGSLMPEDEGEGEGEGKGEGEGENEGEGAGENEGKGEGEGQGQGEGQGEGENEGERAGENEGKGKGEGQGQGEDEGAGENEGQGEGEDEDEGEGEGEDEE